MLDADFLEASRRSTIPVAGAHPPETIYIELADYCNLNCTFCFREREVQQTGDRGGFVQLDKIKILERPLRAARYCGLSGRIGEPLLHPRLNEFLQWLYDINPEIRLRITTNGTSLSRKMAALLANRIDFIGISLNASNAGAYLRDMRPVGSHPNTDWSTKWTNIIRRITEFMAALPADDRSRVFCIMPTHRDNVDDVTDFVRLVESMGCSHAVITTMQVHDEDKIDQSIYWIKDKYNDAIDEASRLGAELGVRVTAARFYSAAKTEVDLETVCREPLEVAYLNMEKLGKTMPCCHWVEDWIPKDVYSDESGFDRFWNNDVLQRLRKKRDARSCQICGLVQSFDDLGFHLKPHLKNALMLSGRLTAAKPANVVPIHDLARACRINGLDLPSLRRTLHRLGVPLGRLDSIATEGAASLPGLDRACWEAFLGADPEIGPTDLSLAGCFLGIGWGDAELRPAERTSVRWLAPNRSGSVFVRVEQGSLLEVQYVAHNVMGHITAGIKLKVCERLLEPRFDQIDNGYLLITVTIPASVTRAYGGRLWLQVSNSDAVDGSFTSVPVAYSRVRLVKQSMLKGLFDHRS